MLSHRILSGAALCGLLLFAGCGTLWAQGATASISGTVADPTGAVVVDAAIQVRNTGTGIVMTAATDGQGRYRVPDLVIGDYEV